MSEEKAKVYFQAHRGGGAHEAPDNTMSANRYAWSLGGIPEADIRSTSDGIIICLHDNTLARTTNAPDAIKDMPVGSLSYEEIRKWNAGVHFGGTFQGEKVPVLEEVFSEMKNDPDRMIYLDLKDVDLDRLGRMINQYGINEQVIFAHNVQENCGRMKKIAAGVKSMLWIGGNGEQIQQRYLAARDSGFSGLDQVQIHLNSAPPAGKSWPYQVNETFLIEALAETGRLGIDLEVLPFTFSQSSIDRLLDIGIRWFATDEPSRFVQYVRSWQEKNIC
ncbi:glycerophosphodiester phosphodiesterase [Bacillaceae bacterium Marseille-Q3522]|nr:glycerophosphodiester phosphodiesterase [Bacillaceae bacterium Marseille-Q3522]